jgi:hypothetical protein
MVEGRRSICRIAQAISIVEWEFTVKGATPASPILPVTHAGISTKTGGDGGERNLERHLRQPPGQFCSHVPEMKSSGKILPSRHHEVKLKFELQDVYY